MLTALLLVQHVLWCTASLLQALLTPRYFGFCCPPPPRRAGVLTDQSYEEFARVIANFAGSHFVFAKTILPVMKKSENSSMLFITGGVGEETCHVPRAGLSVGTAQDVFVLRLCAARSMLTCHAEARMPPPLPACNKSCCCCARWHLLPAPTNCCRPAGQRVLSADSGLATVGGAAVYGVVRAAQVRRRDGWFRGHVHGTSTRLGCMPVFGLPAHSRLRNGALNHAICPLLSPCPPPRQAEFAEQAPGIHEMRIYALVTRHGGGCCCRG